MSTQFITSTFRPEFVRVADRWYGIGHQQKVSNIHLMTKNETLKFVANIMNEEEKAIAKPTKAKSLTSAKKTGAC
jgi:structural maintenance of chromosome 3 (chondroitin sulfate proteoglycan 6)